MNNELERKWEWPDWRYILKFAWRNFVSQHYSVLMNSHAIMIHMFSSPYGVFEEFHEIYSLPIIRVINCRRKR
jgi:hypothetical protein